MILKAHLDYNYNNRHIIHDVTKERRFMKNFINLSVILLLSTSMAYATLGSGLGDIVEGTVDVAASPVRALTGSERTTTVYVDEDEVTSPASAFEDLNESPAVIEQTVEEKDYGFRSGLRKVGRGTGEVVEGAANIVTAPVRAFADDEHEVVYVD